MRLSIAYDWRVIRRLRYVLFLTASLTGILSGQSAPPVSLPGAVRTDGLTLTLGVAATVKADAAEFVVRLDNDGSKVHLLNLGYDRGDQL
jgi:hypothetical protein